MDEGLLRYFAEREEQRQQETAEAWPAFEAAMTEFVDAHRVDHMLGAFMARMVKEAAVAAYVQGVRHAGGETPKGDVILARALEPIRTWPDLYPAFALFDGRGTNEDGAGE
jgi:GTPase